MNYELLIAMCDRINHLKNWFVQLKNKSECIWKLLGDVLGGLKCVPEPFWSLLRPPLGASWAPLGRSWVDFGSFKIDLGRLLEPFGRVKVILDRFWIDFGAKMRAKISFQGEKI